jgi:prepilin-type processing-associated H-X9-DG protein
VYFEGNPPGGSVIFGPSTPTIYYLPDTTGWSGTFSGRPTAIWKPQLLSVSSGFGITSNQFEFNILWADGRVVVVETATNFENPDWSPIVTNIISGGTCFFSDAQWGEYSKRFYRVRGDLN